MAAATGPELGRTDLGFTPKAWFEELEKGTRLGSEIFGFEGLEKNCRFLKEHEALLRDFFDEAVEWWCPGAFEVHEEVGRVLELGLEVLFKELLQIFEHTVSDPLCLFCKMRTSAYLKHSSRCMRKIFRTVIPSNPEIVICNLILHHCYFLFYIRSSLAR